MLVIETPALRYVAFCGVWMRDGSTPLEPHIPGQSEVVAASVRHMYAGEQAQWPSTRRPEMHLDWIESIS